MSFEIQGSRGRVAVRAWPNEDARYVALLSHGYGEHIGRYDHVADHLVDHGAAVYGPDHVGHGRSEGERVLIEDFDDVVDDFHAVAERAREEHPGLPVVVIGHSMGGLIAARYAQRHRDALAALVLSGPAVGANPDIEGLLELDPIPEVPIDPAVLSRDPTVGERYAADELVWHGPFKRPTLQALFAAVGAVADGPALDGLPVLWIHGEADALVPLVHARPAVERLGGDRLEERVYPEACHEVFNETCQDEVLADVTAFLDRAMRG